MLKFKREEQKMKRAIQAFPLATPHPSCFSFGPSCVFFQLLASHTANPRLHILLRYTTYHRPIDIFALVAITTIPVAACAGLCVLLVALLRAHRWTIAHAQECAIAFEIVEKDVTDVIEEAEMQVQGRRLRTRENEVEVEGEGEGEGTRDVFVEVEPWRLEKIHTVEERFRSIPLWFRKLLSIDV